MRRIGVVTVGRSDYGIYRPVLVALRAAVGVELKLFVGGMHLSAAHGRSVTMVEADAFDVAARIEMVLATDTPEGAAKSLGLGVIGYAQAFSAWRPDILVVLGDRYEMYAAAVAALPLSIPVAHIHGGELSEGTMDDALRHSMTKLSHLHFVSAEPYARRVRQLGEEPWRVVVSGAPSLDNVNMLPLLGREELASRLGLDLSVAPLLVTFHPVSYDYAQAEWQVNELLEALQTVDRPVVVTAPNADPGGQMLRRSIESFVVNRPSSRFISDLGTQAYFSLMAVSSAMVGNSSSGVIEAASFHLPVVNVGDRQRGRIRTTNVLDVGHRRDEIVDGIRRALAPEFRNALNDLENPYGDGRAAERILEVLKTVELGPLLVKKRFVDVAGEA